MEVGQPGTPAPKSARNALCSAIETDNLGYTDAAGGFQIVGRAKLVDGKLAPLPSERAVGPMGDKPIFRVLEAYVNFSIRFKMALAKATRCRMPPGRSWVRSWPCPLRPTRSNAAACRAATLFTSKPSRLSLNSL